MSSCSLPLGVTSFRAILVCSMNPTEIVLSVTDTIAQYLREHPKLRLISLLLSPLMALLALAGRHVAALTDGSPQTAFQQLLGNVALFLFGIAVYLLGCSVLALTRLRVADTSISSELERLRGEREELKKRVEVESSKGDAFDSIQLSLNQLTEYYTINKGQARNSFRSSLFALVVGLATLISGIWFFYFHQGNVQLAALSSISGVLIQFIGGAYFVLYRKSLEQLNFFYENLVTMQDTMLAIQLTEQLEEGRRSEVYEKIIMSLMSRRSRSASPSSNKPASRQKNKSKVNEIFAS